MEEKAIDEYDPLEDIFPKVMPWLFPGGVGGPYDLFPKKRTMQDWGEACLYYEDGRFAKDKIFAFYALSYINRHRNDSQGRFFVNKFETEVTNIEDLKERVQKDDCKWISKLLYFSSSIKGSSSYWRANRYKIKTWINYHVSEGHGPPNLFITLSCAEYYWKDIARLLKQRFDFPGVQNPLDAPDANGRINTVKNVNDFSIIVQEYFQKRVQNWLKTIGKKIFMIKHYWLRYEFAPTRGQIHTHMLVITDHNKFIQNTMNEYKDHTKMADSLAGWMEKTFGVTASMPTTVNVDEVTCQEIEDIMSEDETRTYSITDHPSNFTRTDVIREAQKYKNDSAKEKQVHERDTMNLFRSLPLHKCNAYSMRNRNIQRVDCLSAFCQFPF